MTGYDPSISSRPLGLVTDLYELRMVETCLHDGLTAPATFSLYIRPSTARPWYLAAGVDRALDLLERFTYGADDLDYLRTLGLGDELLRWLSTYAFEGEVRAVSEGTVVLADEPLLEVTASLPVAMLVETALLNVVQLSTVLATKAARCAIAADGRDLADFGLRRAHGLEAGIEAARAAYVAGVGATSNVEAGRRYGIPVVGTMAHSFIQALEDETAAFRSFARDHPGNAVLLVDTYDTIQGVRNAVRVGDELRAQGRQLDGIRIDSGDLGSLAAQARRILDAAGHSQTRIFASGGLDEFAIGDLVADDAPIDAFGVGTALTVSRDHPASDIVYKLVAYDGQPRAKYSEGKVLLPGAKQVWRRDGPSTDVLGTRDEQQPGDALLRPVWRRRERLVPPDIDGARRRAESQLARLPADWRRPEGPTEAPYPRVSAALAERGEQVRRREMDG